MAVTLPKYPLSSEAIKSEVDANFNALATKFGQIGNEDIRPGAAIDVDKLSAQYEYFVVRLVASTTTSTGYKDYCPIPYDTKGPWTVAGASFLMDDAGSTGPTFTVVFGYPTSGSAVWNNSTTVVDSTLVTASDGNYQSGGLTVAGSTIVPTVNQESLALRVTTAGTSSGPLYVSLMLKRKIAT